MNEKDAAAQNVLLNELVKERPEITYLTELGITLQDYITAEVLMLENKGDPFNDTLYTNYAMCLFFTVAERLKVMSEYLQ